jgi:phytoene dehydrogenase-like protein
MHLHLGFDATDVPKDIELHHIVVNDWEPGVNAQQNVVLISVPNMVSPNLAPMGKHVLHAYTPGTEPYDLWVRLDRRSAKQKQRMKQVKNRGNRNNFYLPFVNRGYNITVAKNRKKRLINL